MSKNPFLNKKNTDPEGSMLEQFEVRHNMRRDSIEYPDVDAEWEKLRAKIEQNADAGLADEESFADGKHTLWGSSVMRIAASGAVILAIAVALLVYLGHRDAVHTETVYVAKQSDLTDIILKTTGSPAKKVVGNLNFTPKAILPASSIATPNDTIIIETPAGKDLMVCLPDSSKMLLLANSRVEFISDFDYDTRNVKLEGEAFFDVATDSLHPFVVTTPYLTTCVYGTEFRISADGPKNSSVVLIDGKLAVTAPGSDEEAWLSPGEGAFYESGDGLHIEEVDLYPYLQWRDGLFYFDNSNLFSILVKIGQWYNVNIVSENDSLLRQQYHFVADRSLPVEDIVTEISVLTNSSVKFEGNQISIR